MERIIKYLTHKYNPLSIILYGSYANGTNNLNSDFDALVISAEYKQYHDTSFVDGVQLDVFVYPVSYFEGKYDCEGFIQVFDGNIITDSNDVGRSLKTKVQTYLQNRPRKTREDIQANVDWCVKMLERVKRCDAEGMFRWHWLLTDSLEIFCDIKQQPYYGPKKALRWMGEKHPEAFECYKTALQDFSADSLAHWVAYLANTTI